jgi:hypothetical protein
MRQPSSGPLSHKDELTIVPVVETADEFKKQDVRKSGLSAVWVTMSETFGIEPGGDGREELAAGSW